MHAKPEVDVGVIGAGVVGLACAASLARRGRSVVIVERHAQIALETTSRNSQVVHAGIYNPPDWLKTKLCIAGRHALVERCARWNVPYRKTGKLILATEEGELSRLEELLERGRANGVEGLEFLDAGHVQECEPGLRAVAAIESPETGIVDAVGYARSFLGEAENAGAAIAFETEVREIERVAGGYRLRARREIEGGGGRDGTESDVRCACIVNAAGLAADRVAAAAGIELDARGYRLHPCKGDYFAIDAQAPIRFSRLIYPLPRRAGLGVHATLDLNGAIRFGPDAEYVDSLDLHVDPGKAGAFCAAIRRYLPQMQESWLLPDSAGIRPKLSGPGQEARDFVVKEESEAGLPGFVNLLGIESPGLTAAAAIGEFVADLLAGA